MTEPNIDDLAQRVEQLPLLPSVVARLLAVSPDDNDYFEQLLALAREDPPFALRLIRLANSSFSAPVDPISTIQGAIVRIGGREINNLVTSMAVMQVFMPSTKGERELWVHSVQVAVASRAIARTVRSHQVDAEHAYLCGLVHDIGRFILFEGDSEALGRVEDVGWQTPGELVEVERDSFGFDHGELGGRVCERWTLSRLVTDVVRHHHASDLAAVVFVDKGVEDMIRVVQVADYLSVFLIRHPDATSWESDRLESELARQCLGPGPESILSAGQLLELLPTIVEESDRRISGLGIRVS